MRWLLGTVAVFGVLALIPGIHLLGGIVLLLMFPVAGLRWAFTRRLDDGTPRRAAAASAMSLVMAMVGITLAPAGAAPPTLAPAPSGGSPSAAAAGPTPIDQAPAPSAGPAVSIGDPVDTPPATAAHDACMAYEDGVDSVLAESVTRGDSMPAFRMSLGFTNVTDAHDNTKNPDNDFARMVNDANDAASADPRYQPIEDATYAIGAAIMSGGDDVSPLAAANHEMQRQCQILGGIF